MNENRLLRLADLLEANAKNKKGAKFDLSAWAKNKKKTKKMPVSCGTTACAFGLAAISGAFKADGLSYRQTLETDGNSMVKWYFIHPTFKGDEDFRASMSFFSIDDDAAHYLFNPKYYPKPYQKGSKAERFVARRIRDYVTLQHGLIT